MYGCGAFLACRLGLYLIKLRLFLVFSLHFGYLIDFFTMVLICCPVIRIRNSIIGGGELPKSFLGVSHIISKHRYGNSMNITNILP